MNLSVFLSNRCNLGCHYCAVRVNRDEPLFLDVDRLKRGIDYYLSLKHASKRSVTLLGGEPFLNFPALLRIADHIQRQRQIRGVPITLAIYTNGTFLTQEKLSQLRRREATVWLSIDGAPASNDRHRTFAGAPKRSVSAAVEERLRGLEAAELKVNMVVHGDTAGRLVADVDYLRRLGFGSINFHPELWEQCSPGQLQDLKRALQEFAWYYRRLWQVLGRAPFTVPILSLIFDHRLDPEQPQAWWETCDNLVLGADGRFYSCERNLAQSYDTLAERVIGDIDNGVDWARKEELLDEARRFLRRIGSAKKWHHCCPKGIYFYARQRGIDPETLLASFQEVSRVFGEGILRVCEAVSDLPGFSNLYPGLAPRQGATR